MKPYGFGAVDFMSGQLTHHVGERKNSENLILPLVGQIFQPYCPGEKWPGLKVMLAIDNYIIHRTKKTAAVQAEDAGPLCVVALPTCASKLNLTDLNDHQAEVLSITGNPQ